MISCPSKLKSFFVSYTNGTHATTPRMGQDQTSDHTESHNMEISFVLHITQLIPVDFSDTSEQSTPSLPCQQIYIRQWNCSKETYIGFVSMAFKVGLSVITGLGELATRCDCRSKKRLRRIVLTLEI